MNNSLFTSNKNDWETPQSLFDQLNSFYHFTIDVASSDLNCKVKKHYTILDDGLKQSWDNEIVWCNPPYGRNLDKWVEKAYYSRSKTIMLLPARTDTKWFHNYIYNKPFVKVIFIKGRLKFSNSKNSAPFPSMIVIFERI